MFSPRVSVSRVSVVTELASDDTYDVIFVPVRYTQLETVIAALKANKTENIVLVGNNVRTRKQPIFYPRKTLCSVLQTRRDTEKTTVWFRLTCIKLLSGR